MQAGAPVTAPEAKKENWFIRFIVTIVWLVLSVGVDVYALLKESYLIGAGTEFAFFLITFMVPYLRKKGTYTRWFGWLALMQGAWLIYLMVSNG